jgi:hypothetical protein
MENIENIKEEGEWVLRNIYFSRKVLVSKSLWRVIKIDGL